MKARIEFTDDDAVGGFAAVEIRDTTIEGHASIALFLMHVIDATGYTIGAISTALICELARDGELSDKQIAEIREAISE